MKQIGSYLIYGGVIAFCIVFSVVILVPHSPANGLVSAILCGSNELVVNHIGELGVTRNVTISNLECLQTANGMSYPITNHYLLLLFVSGVLPICFGLVLRALQHDYQDEKAIHAFDEEDPDILRAKLEQMKEDCDAGEVEPDEYVKRLETLLKEFI